MWQVEPMLAEVRAYRLPELREMLAMTNTTWLPSCSQSEASLGDRRGPLDLTKIDTLRRYADALGGTLRVEVKVGDETYQIA